jgi:hypothetical protein
MADLKHGNLGGGGEHKPDASLIATGVEYLCGEPDTKAEAGATNKVYDLPGPEGVEANGVGPMTIFINSVTPNAAADEPSDTNAFRGSAKAATGR